MTPLERSQVQSVVPVLLLTLTQGLSLGWSSPAVGKLRAGEGPFPATLDEISWIVSFFSLGILAGSMVRLPPPRDARPAGVAHLHIGPRREVRGQGSSAERSQELAAATL